MRKLLVFLKRGWITFTSYRMEVILRFAGLFGMVTAFYFVAEMMNTDNIPELQKYAGNYTSFVISGIVFQWFAGAALNSFSSSIRSEQAMGTLEFLLMSATSIGATLVYSSVWSFTRVFTNAATVFVISALIFDIPFNANVASAFIVLTLTITSLSGIGMMSAGMTLAFKQGDPINWLFLTLSGLLSGVFFPIDLLPNALKEVAYLLPTTYSLLALRETLISEAPISSILPQLIVLMVFSLCLIPTGILLFQWGFKKARQNGDLSHY